jgi:hypothetical protein
MPVLVEQAVVGRERMIDGKGVICHGEQEVLMRFYRHVP